METALMGAAPAAPVVPVSPAPAPAPVLSQPVPAPAAAPAPAAPVPVQSPADLRAAIQAAGFDPTGLDDARLAQVAAAALREASEAKRALQSPEWLAFQEQMAKQAAPAPAPAQPKWLTKADIQSKLNLVDYDQATGIVRPKPGVMQSVADEVSLYLRQRQEIEEKWYDDPKSYVKQLLADEIKAEAQKAIEVWQKQQEEQAFLSQQKEQAGKFAQEHQHWMFQMGPDGQMARDLNGAPLLSPMGKQFGAYARAAESQGFGPMAAASYALGQMQMSGLQIPGKPQPAAAPEPSRQEAFNLQQAMATRSNGLAASQAAEKATTGGVPDFGGDLKRKFAGILDSGALTFTK